MKDSESQGKKHDLRYTHSCQKRQIAYGKGFPKE